MLIMSKTRYTDDETQAIIKWMASNKIKSSWVDIYLYKIPNREIVKHLIVLFNRAYNNSPMPIPPTILKGIRAIIEIEDDLQ